MNFFDLNGGHGKSVYVVDDWFRHVSMNSLLLHGSAQSASAAYRCHHQPVLVSVLATHINLSMHGHAMRHTETFGQFGEAFV